MTSYVSKSSVFIAFLSLLLLLCLINGENDLCTTSSMIWKGICIRSDHCDAQCREKDSALGGHCDYQQCWCHYSSENLCQKPSGIWHGSCFNGGHCSKQCNEKENSLRGFCDDQHRCQCIYNCNK